MSSPSLMVTFTSAVDGSSLVFSNDWVISIEKGQGETQLFLTREAQDEVSAIRGDSNLSNAFCARGFLRVSESPKEAIKIINAARLPAQKLDH